VRNSVVASAESTAVVERRVDETQLCTDFWILAAAPFRRYFVGDVEYLASLLPENRHPRSVLDPLFISVARDRVIPSLKPLRHFS
jgi:hypothetical protein